MAAKLRHLDLFSGIGGFALGLRRTGGFETVQFVEIDPYCRRVLAKHWPGVPCHDDVRTFDAVGLGRIDIVTGGFPCQDVSIAGQQQGFGGARSGLWSELCRILGALRPCSAIVENVPNLLAGPTERPGGWFGRVLGDLAALGFDAEWHCIPASAIGAAFEGDRVWLVATPTSDYGQERMGAAIDRPSPKFATGHVQRAFADLDLRMASPCGLARDLDGFSDFVDRRQRTTALGNAVVPAIVTELGHAILQAKAPAR